MNTYTQTFSGHMVDILNVKPSDIYMMDVIRSLQKQVRFNGHSTVTVDLITHSIMVCEIANEDAKPYALVHDFHEYLTGDIPGPMRNAVMSFFPDEPIDPFHHIKNRIDIAIYEAFGLETPSADVLKEVKRADLVALSTDKNFTMRKQINDEINWFPLPDPMGAEATLIYNLERPQSEFWKLVNKHCPKVPPYSPEGCVF